METRYAHHPEDIKTYTTERSQFLGRKEMKHATKRYYHVFQRDVGGHHLI